MFIKKRVLLEIGSTMSNTKFQNTCYSLNSLEKMNPPSHSPINTKSYNEISLFTLHHPLFLLHTPN